MRKSLGRRAVIFLLCAAMMIGILPGLMPEAKATDTYYPIWIGGTQVTSQIADDIFRDPNSIAKASYDPNTNTLTLNGYQYKGLGYNNAAIYYSGNETLKIVLKNNNSISHEDDGINSQSYGIYIFSPASVEISGSGTLTVYVENDYNYGIFLNGGNLLINNGNIKAVAIEGLEYNYGIYAEYITIAGGSLYASGSSGNGECYGIYAKRDVTISGGAVTGYGGAKNTSVYPSCVGIYAGGNVTISGGTVEARTAEIFKSDNDTGIECQTLTIGSGCESFVAKGYGKAIDAKVINAIPGISWTDYDGTQGKAEIAVSSTARTLDSGIRKVHFHEHDFSYALSEDGSTITRTCNKGGCYLENKQSALTISAPADLTYSGKAKEAVITDPDGIRENAEIKNYTTADGASSWKAIPAAPADIGSYKAEITLGSGNDAKTAGAAYTIAPAELTAVSAAQDGALTYTGSPQTAKVKTAAKSVNQQAVSFAFRDDPKGVYAVAVPAFTDVGEHTVYYKACAPNHKDAEGSFTVSIGKADPAVTAPTAKPGLVCTGAPLELITAGSTKDGEMQYSLGAAPGTWSTAVPTAIDAGNYFVWYKVVGDKNHKDTDPASIAVTIAAKPDEGGEGGQGEGGQGEGGQGEGGQGEGGNEPAIIDLSKAAIAAIKDQTYTGKAITPKLSVTCGGKTLAAGTDYTVSCAGNKNIGTATVTITGVGNYTGTKTASFKIIPKKVSLSSPKAGKGSLTVKWKAGKGIDGYEIEYGLKKDFKGSKKITVKKAKTTSYVIKKLTSKQKYYVRIRAFKKVKGKKYYSEWSKVKGKKAK